MKRLDKSQFAAWVLLSVFIPMVLLSSIHIHPEVQADALCELCLDHTVHNGHISSPVAYVDCPLCAFQNVPYQGQQGDLPAVYQSATLCEAFTLDGFIVTGTPGARSTRAPPFTFCA